MSAGQRPMLCKGARGGELVNSKLWRPDAAPLRRLTSCARKCRKIRGAPSGACLYCTRTSTAQRKRSASRKQPQAQPQQQQQQQHPSPPRPVDEYINYYSNDGSENVTSRLQTKASPSLAKRYSLKPSKAVKYVATSNRKCSISQRGPCRGRNHAEKARRAVSSTAVPSTARPASWQRPAGRTGTIRDATCTAAAGWW
jgi:hypothetical protein